MASPTTIYTNATVFTGVADAPTREAFAVQGDRVLAAGSLDAVRIAAGAGSGRAGSGADSGSGGGGAADGAAADGEVNEIDLEGAFVMPGTMEGHAHMLMLGEALDKVQLRDCETIAEVQDRLRAARAENPSAPRVLGVSWRFDMFAEGQQPTAAMLDEAVADVPVILDANDLHSVWANTAALEAMGITRDTPDPVGGEIVRDADGNATGFLLETAAVQFGWGYLEAVNTDEDRDRFLDNAFQAYLATGVTGASEMSFNDAALDTYKRRLDRDGRLPFPVNAHWLLTATGDLDEDLAQIDHIVAARDAFEAEYGRDWLRIVGVKFISDGVIDACTAAMRAPFANGAKPPSIWAREFAIPVAIAADAAGLQLAVHAIGDEASTIALEMFEAVARENGPNPHRRPRVEHLEYVADDIIARMAAVGATASMQPVHCDPAVMDNWKAMLGDDRAENGFPWHKFRESGVLLALGTDAPTAPHEAPHNLFIALTAKSILDPSRDPYRPERVFTVADALEAMTAGPALATKRGDELGQIAPGYRANFTVLDTNPFTDAPDALVGTQVRATYVNGEVAYTA